MANIKSQIKRNRTNEKARLRNRVVRSDMRTAIRKAEKAAGTETSDAELASAIRKIDKAVSKGVLHRNTAARTKSRLIKRVRSAA